MYFQTIESAYKKTFGKTTNIKGKILIISGASGVGKSTQLELMSRFTATHEINNISSRSTRKDEEPSPFLDISNNHFKYLSKKKKTLGWHFWPGNNHTYGLLKSEVEKIPEEILTIYQTTWLGNILKSQNHEKILNIWLTLDNKLQLNDRLKKRGTEVAIEREKRVNQTYLEQEYILCEKQKFINSGQIDYFFDTSDMNANLVHRNLVQFLRKKNFI